MNNICHIWYASLGLITTILGNLPVFSYSFFAAACVMSKPTYKQTWKMRNKKGGYKLPKLRRAPVSKNHFEI